MDRNNNPERKGNVYLQGGGKMKIKIQQKLLTGGLQKINVCDKKIYIGVSFMWCESEDKVNIKNWVIIKRRQQCIGYYLELHVRVKMKIH